MDKNNQLKKYDMLKKYFGYDSFREGQEVLIDAILEGRDVLGIMPTGAGKSICYQVPARNSALYGIHGPDIAGYVHKTASREGGNVKGKRCG